MTNVKRKGLVYALILTLCLGVIPFNVASFQAAAETKSKAPAVTAKTYSKKAGRYTVNKGGLQDRECIRSGREDTEEGEGKEKGL